MTPTSLLEARQRHLQGALADALRLYRAALEQDPDCADALHGLAVLALQTGKNADALLLIDRAIILRPKEARYHCTRGQALTYLKRMPEAATAQQMAAHLQPDLADAWFGLGIARQTMGEADNAIDAYQHAIATKADYAEAFNNLGNVFQGQRRWQQAIEAYQRALTLRPDYVDARHNLGSALLSAGDIDQAIAELKIVIEQQPRFVLPYNSLGNALAAKREFDHAVTVFQKAVELRPDFDQAWYNLGNALNANGEYPRAVEAYRKAIALRGDYFDAMLNLGNALQGLSQFKEAADAYLQAAKCRPDSFQAYNNLGSVMRTLGALDDAAMALRRAIDLDGDLAVAHCNLGNVLKDAGQVDESLNSYRKAIELKPSDSVSHSNLLYTMHYHPAYSAAAIAQEARHWNAQHAAALQNAQAEHCNTYDPDRPLRIGYVGADFRDHCQALFLLPLLKSHNRQAVTVICYANVARPDVITERFRGLADQWRNIRGISDIDAASIIRADGVDILVDLTSHMSGNRLLLFARKPAPVQISWLAYPGTTGLDAMDFRLTDPHLDGPDADANYSERSLRLPDAFWCFDPMACETPDAPAPEPGPLPALANGHITFGCLNNFCKVTPDTLHLWARIVQATAQSRLILLSPAGQHRQRILDLFAGHGIGGDRIEFTEFQPRTQYLQTYQRIDLGLDTFPYNGHTTSLDSLWMGVPVITRIGSTAVGRAGLSQLSNIGLTELAAPADEAFVRTAVCLAADTGRLSALRQTLRSRMIESPLMDCQRFAQAIERTYRQAWQMWCTRRSNELNGQ